MKHLMLITGLILMSACSSVTQKTTGPYTSYRAEMIFDVNGADGPMEYRGLALVPSAPETTLRLTSPIPLDRLEISTCGRHEVRRDVDKQSTWFSEGESGYELVYTYRPTAEESKGVCPIMFQAFSKDSQKAWGMLFFKSDQTLPAEMDCNGGHRKFSGLSICQSKAGIDQLLVFKVPVMFESNSNCVITTEDKKSHLVRSTKEFCRASFTDGKNYHDLVLLGYNQVIIY